MPPQLAPGALAFTRKVLRALIALNFVVGLLILLLLVASLVAKTWVMQALGVPDDAEHATLFPGMRLIMVFGIVAAPITHAALSRLRTIVETVRAGDPFVSENASRLTTIAWAVLALEILHVVIAGVARSVSTATTPLDITWDFSVSRWLAVLLLFVLARVFETGARMRADLQGTV